MKSFAVFCLLGSKSSLAYATRNSCCAQLEFGLGTKVHYPGDQVYNVSLSSYWSQQEQSIQPRCVVRPQSSQDVAKAIQILAAAPKCKFAVKSGGHMAQAGASNIADGITIDLSALTSFSIDKSKRHVTLGPGLRWGEVYNKLEAHGLAVPGGRSSDVGIGGYLLGGGLSYFIGHGFGCDNVVAYKIVLANGVVLEANSVSHPELFRSLKGGSNNFGIVVSFTLRTFPLGRVWGGNMVYPAVATVHQQLQAFRDFVGDDHYDINAAIQMSISFAPSVGVIFVNQPFYALPQVNPPALQRFTTIKPLLQDQTSLTTLTAFANSSAELSPRGSRQMAWSISFENQLPTLHALYAAFNDSISSIANISGISWSITLEPLPNSLLFSSEQRGGNSLGLGYKPKGKGLVLCDSSFTWTHEKDDFIVRRTGLQLLRDILKELRRLGTLNNWVDLNHADYFQDPIGSYGYSNGLLLHYVSKRYDPGEMFQTQLPGGFKLLNVS